MGVIGSKFSAINGNLVKIWKISVKNLKISHESIYTLNEKDSGALITTSDSMNFLFAMIEAYVQNNIFDQIIEKYL